MSGGYWNYKNDYLASDIFGYYLEFGCGLDGEKHDKNLRLAVKEDPLGDPEASALVFDVFCLLNGFDLAKSGDIDMSRYYKNLEAFKQRWLKTPRIKQIQTMIDITVENLKQELYETFSLDKLE